MPAVVIADTSCLIYLTALGQLQLLSQLYSDVWITPTIAAEYGLPLPPWMRVQMPRDEIRTVIFGAGIDIGEASAIALALETPECVVVLDNRRGRRAASRLHLRTYGYIGLAGDSQTAQPDTCRTAISGGIAGRRYAPCPRG